MKTRLSWKLRNICLAAGAGVAALTLGGCAYYDDGSYGGGMYTSGVYDYGWGWPYYGGYYGGGGYWTGGGGSINRPDRPYVDHHGGGFGPGNANVRPMPHGGGGRMGGGGMRGGGGRR